MLKKRHISLPVSITLQAELPEPDNPDTPGTTDPGTPGIDEPGATDPPMRARALEREELGRLVRLG